MAKRRRRSRGFEGLAGTPEEHMAKAKQFGSRAEKSLQNAHRKGILEGDCGYALGLVVQAGEQLGEMRAHDSESGGGQYDRVMKISAKVDHLRNMVVNQCFVRR